LDGLKLDHLMQCFNEECQKDWKFRQMIELRLLPYAGELEVAKVDTGVFVDPTPKPLTLPGPCVSIGELPSNHLGVYYMTQMRGFDVQELSEHWQVMWCYDSKYMNALNRVIFPIFWYGDDGKLHLFGYQCRYITQKYGDKPPTKMIPKYWTGPGTRKSRLIYNAHAAAGGPLVVVGEGPTDAIRIGRQYGVALFGKSISSEQIDILWANWGAKGARIVVALDDDAKGESKDTLLHLQKTWPRDPETQQTRVTVLELPSGKDPGDIERNLLWRMIVDAGAKVGWNLQPYAEIACA
jgi:hypothetical protein